METIIAPWRKKRSPRAEFRGDKVSSVFPCPGQQGEHTPLSLPFLQRVALRLTPDAWCSLWGIKPTVLLYRLPGLYLPQIVPCGHTYARSNSTNPTPRDV